MEVFSSTMAVMISHQKAQKYLATVDPKLAVLIEKYGDCKLEPHTNYYKELVDSIVSQQLPVQAPGRTM